MSTAYAGSIDQTEESANGGKFTAIAGTGGVTAGYAVKYDGSTAKTVILCTATSDIFIGVAAADAAEGALVTVLGNNCKVKVPATITIAGKVGITTGSLPCSYASGGVLGICETSAASASVIRVQIQY